VAAVVAEHAPLDLDVMIASCRAAPAYPGVYDERMTRVVVVSVVLAELICCRNNETLTAPKAGSGDEHLTTSAVAGHATPLRIRRFCTVRPPDAASQSDSGSVWIKTVLTGAMGGNETSQLLLSLRCKWHEKDDSVARGIARPSSWGCELKSLDLDIVAGGFEVVRAKSKDLGHMLLESWSGQHRIELHDREFSIDEVDTLALLGRFVLRCPRALKDLPPFGVTDPTLTAGCEVAIENDNTHDRIVGSYDGEYEVAGVFVTSDRKH